MTYPVNLWPWFAAAVLALVAIADGSLIVAARVTRPAAVEARPWLASADLDRLKASRERFTAAGYRLLVNEDGAGVRISLVPYGATIGAAKITLYRPDDAVLDRQLRWNDPSTDLRIEVPRAGLWRLHLESTNGLFAADHILEKRP
jgi:hypothetical protein